MKIWVADWDNEVTAYREKSVLLQEIEEVIESLGWHSVTIDVSDEYVRVDGLVIADLVELQ